MTASAQLLTVVGTFIVLLGIWWGFWAWVDAHDRALMRKREAEMADALQRSVRQARIPAKGTEPNRYLTSDPDRPE